MVKKKEEEMKLEEWQLQIEKVIVSIQGAMKSIHSVVANHEERLNK